jgi:hypothetical protein
MRMWRGLGELGMTGTWATPGWADSRRALEAWPIFAAASAAAPDLGAESQAGYADAIERRVRFATAQPWTKVLAGHAPSWATPVAPTSRQVQALVADPRFRYLGPGNRLGRHWLQQLSTTALLCALCLNSARMGGGSAPLPDAHLTRLTGLSTTGARNVIRQAIRTGELVRLSGRASDAAGGFDLSPPFAEAVEDWLADLVAAMAIFVQRPDPLPGLSASARREALRLVLRLVLAECGVAGPARIERGGPRRNLMYLVLDIVTLTKPRLRTVFVAEAAARLDVTPITALRLLQQAEDGKWLASEESIVAPSDAAKARAGLAFGSLATGWAAVLSAIDLITEHAPPVPRSKAGIQSA